MGMISNTYATFCGAFMAMSLGAGAAATHKVSTIALRKMWGIQADDSFDKSAGYALMAICVMIEQIDDSPEHMNLKTGAILAASALGAFFGSDAYKIGDEITGDQIDQSGKAFLYGAVTGFGLTILPFPTSYHLQRACVGFLAASAVSTFLNPEPLDPHLNLN